MTTSTEVRQPSGRHLPEGEIRITAADCDRLEALVASQSRQHGASRDQREALEREIDRALVVSSHEVPPDVVTMNSRVLVRDVDTGAEMELTAARHFHLQCRDSRGGEMRVEVRAVEMALAKAMREYIEQRLRKAIAHAGDRVGGVTVELSENHGPLGRADWRCRIIAEPLPSGAVVQREVVGPRLLAAIETASERLWCAVRGFPQDRSQAGAGG